MPAFESPKYKEYQEESKKKQTIASIGGKKIKGKEAEKLKKKGITLADIKKTSSKLSKKGTKVYSGKPSSSKKKSSSKDFSFDASPYQSEMDATSAMLEQFQIQQQQQMQQYETMLKQQAKEAKKQQKAEMEALKIQQQNAASAALTPSFQLQGAGVTPKIGAAQQFRRRLGTQFGTGSPYTGLAQISSGMVNV